MEMEMEGKSKSERVKVCVTGGAGYIASFLIKHLLERGYTVHATLRSLSDASKVGLLKGLAHAETRLKLFEGDMYNPAEFAPAINGCHFVFHLATPLQHHQGTQYKNTSEAAVGGVKMIAESCIKSNTVKKLIYTASVMAAGAGAAGPGYKDVIDETCWTPLNNSFEMHYDYVESKTLAEREVLSYNGKGIQVVSLACGLVGGDTIQSFVSDGMATLVSQAMNDDRLMRYKGLRALEDLVSKVPIVHILDVVEAHIFAMEDSHMNGRFLVANAFLKSAEVASIIHNHFPDITIPPELIEDTNRETKWGSRKLEDLGFQYKYDAAITICGSIVCAKKFGNVV